MIDDFRGLELGAGCEVEGAGDIGREPGTGVEVRVAWEDEECLFLCFFRDDSFPLDSDKFGDPGLFRFFAFFRGSVCLGRPEGVLVPFVEVPDGSFDSALALFFASSSFFRSISFCFSSSEVSSSLCDLLASQQSCPDHHTCRLRVWIAVRITLVR
jgi:hypothetical protein